MHNFAITSNIIDITPEYARDILKSNTRNRPINSDTVIDYATQMKKGLWKLNGEPIIISENGNLLDGQHRLEAVVLSGKTIRTLVIYNVSEDSFDTIDTGRVRTLGDILAINEVDNSVCKAAAINSYFRLKKNEAKNAKVSSNVFNNKSLRDLCVSKAEAQKFYTDHKDVIDIALFIANKYNRKLRLMTSSVLSAYILYLVLDKMHSIDTVSKFFSEVYQLAPETNSTISVYRSMMLRHLTKQHILTPTLKHIYLIKTWNCYIKGKTLANLKYNPDIEKSLNFI